MPLTNFPAGVTSFGLPVIGGGPLSVTTTGLVFFVDSVTGNDAPYNSSSGQGTNPSQPFKTLSIAMTQTRASKGDVIYLMPGHAELIPAAATLNFFKAGVQVIGLGIGSNRPSITYAGTDSLLLFSAASTALRNVRLLCSVDEVVTALSVTAANVTIDTVDVVETAAKQFIQKVLTTAAAVDLTITNCTDHQSTAPAANSAWIKLVGADRANIIGNRIFITTTNSASSSVILSVTTAPVNILIQDNVIVQLGGASVIPINLMTGTSGYAASNKVASPKTTIAGSIALASCYGANNLASHTVNTDGILEPVADA